jgi:protein-L-isoaspartate(D-aspartate) O-methyltransferase
LLEQLAIGGRMVIPVGDRQFQVMKIITRENENDFTETEAGNFVFVPLLPGTVDRKGE